MKHFSVLFTCQFINKTPRGGIRSVVGREGSLTKYGNEARNCGADEIELIFFSSNSPAANYVRFSFFLIDVLADS